MTAGETRPDSLNGASGRPKGAAGNGRFQERGLPDGIEGGRGGERGRLIEGY